MLDGTVIIDWILPSFRADDGAWTTETIVEVRGLRERNENDDGQNETQKKSTQLDHLGLVFVVNIPPVSFFLRTRFFFLSSLWLLLLWMF